MPDTTADYEKLGQFYLGRQYDLSAGKTRDDLVLYDAKDLTTHAVCVGMTGSGKTGLVLSLLEEAAIDGIPAICIDPKGDLGNLLLAFPQLRPEDFQPWIDPAEATRRGQTVDQFAQQTAKTWRDGLAAWNQPPERIAKYRDAVDIAIYTPGSNAGLSLGVLRSFNAPPQELLNDADALRERITGAVSGLLGLLGVDADPLQSREHILVSTVIEKSWRDGKDMDMSGLIRAIQQPPFDKVGFLDLESFFPAKERFALSIRLNNLLASPGFNAWVQGEPLDIARLFHTPEGKPRLTILSIAHLGDAERMFFVTILLNEVLAWMRRQTGTSSLRALLYMDEVFGYFPPTANPPSKQPMLTLLKQARAFGLGVMLATQNPVDLDYKGLSNAGTWFLGRLQTERDKLRVLDGLEGASVAAGSHFDRSSMEKILSGLGNRVFLMNNVHDDHPVVFQTRWALSYLCGPMSKDQIARLMAERKQTVKAAAPTSVLPAQPAGPGGDRPVLPPGITERFVAQRTSLPSGTTLLYRPALLGAARVHFTSASAGVDLWRTVVKLAHIEDGANDIVWDEDSTEMDGEPEMDQQPAPGARFASLPTAFTAAKKYQQLAGGLKEHLYRGQALSLYRCPTLKQTSGPGETEGDFRVRLGQSSREERDRQVEKLRARYAPKLATVQEQLRRAQQKVEKERAQAKEKTVEAMISFGSTVLGALFGRKLASATNIGKAATSVRSAGKIFKERGEVGAAEESVESVQAKLETLEAELKSETEKIQQSFDPASLSVEELPVKPKKTDVSVGQVVLVWTPWKVTTTGLAEPLFE